MAYMNQEKKSAIAAELKKVIPADWKWSLAVHHHSTIILTIAAAPINLFAIANDNDSPYKWTDGYVQLNEYHLGHNFKGELLETFQRIKDAMNLGNWDKSDIMTDYFDVGHYVNIHIGKWNKPFQTSTPATSEARAERTELARLKAQLAALDAKHEHDYVLDADDIRRCSICHCAWGH